MIAALMTAAALQMDPSAFASACMAGGGEGRDPDQAKHGPLLATPDWRRAPDRETAEI